MTLERNNEHCFDLSLFFCISPSHSHCSELLVSSAKADLTLQDAVKNTALHLACSKVGINIWWHCSYTLQQQMYTMLMQVLVEILYILSLFTGWWLFTVLLLFSTGT